MPVSHLEHYLIQTEDIDRTCDWYVQACSAFASGRRPISVSR